MTRVKKRISLSVVVATAALSVALPASATAAWDGQITRAEADSAWTLASVAGSAEWTGCEHWVDWEPTPWEYPEPGSPWWEPTPLPYCGWLPYATLGPGSQPSDCESESRNLNDLGEEVTLIWEGTGSARYRQNFLAAEGFDKTDIPLGGSDHRLICLSAMETAPVYRQIFCIQVVGHFCPPFAMREFRHELGSALLTAGDGDEGSDSQSGVSAANGEFTRAEASPDGSSASMAGSLNWNFCEFPPGWNWSTICRWRPYVTVGPGTDTADCSSASRRWGQLGEGVSLVWSGSQSGNPGSAAFDVTEVPLPGEAGRLACLSVGEDLWEACVNSTGPVCLTAIGNSATRFRVLDAAFLETPPEPPSPEDPGEEEPESEGEASGQTEDRGSGLGAGPASPSEKPGTFPAHLLPGEGSGERLKVRRCPKGKRLVKTRSGRKVCRQRHRRPGPSTHN